MKFRVLSVAIDTTTVPLSLVPPFSLEAPREEVIDTLSNEGFTQCQTVRDVEVTYERFWNFLNGDDAVHDPRQKVKVLLVERLPNA